MKLKIKSRIFPVVNQHNQLSLIIRSKSLIRPSFRMTSLETKLLHNLCLKSLQINSIEYIIRYVPNCIHEYQFEILLREQKAAAT
jgi:hypothetical protein